MKRDSEPLFTLPEHRVEVIETGQRARRHWTACEIDVNLRFDTAALEAYCFAEWNPRVYDAFVVAAAVQFCDHTKKRPLTGWGRDIALRIPVHDPCHWNSEAVSRSLHEALTFLTGDRWDIKFHARRAAASASPQRHFDMPNGSRVIMPYSDGLDSRAVSGLMGHKYGQQLILVRLGSKPPKHSRHAAYQKPFAAVPYTVRIGNGGSVETSARSRGFKFMLLSGIAAYLSQASQIIVSESGQGALGPVLVPVGQAYEDFRNYPLFTERMETFLSVLFGHEVHYAFPRLWNTKSETLAEFVNNCSDGESWVNTRSCWQGQRQVSVSGQLRQCGVCAACLLRRMSVHAMGASEVKETYVWENLGASRFEGGAAPAFVIKKPRGALFEYAIAGTLHLDHLASIHSSQTNKIIVNRNIFYLSKSLRLSEQEVSSKLRRFLKQHKHEWSEFVKSLGPQSFVAQWASGVQ